MPRVDELDAGTEKPSRVVITTSPQYHLAETIAHTQSLLVVPLSPSPSPSPLPLTLL